MKIENINFNKIRKCVKRGTLVLATVTLSAVVTGCTKSLTSVIETKNEMLRKEAAYNDACGIVDAAKLTYAESLLAGEPITSGDASDLEVFGTPATSGTWATIDIDKDGDMEVLLKDVVIGDYICNTASATDEYELDLKTR